MAEIQKILEDYESEQYTRILFMTHPSRVVDAIKNKILELRREVVRDSKFIKHVYPAFQNVMMKYIPNTQ